MVLETEFEWMENSRGKPGGPNTTGWAREPPQCCTLHKGRVNEIQDHKLHLATFNFVAHPRREHQKRHFNDHVIVGCVAERIGKLAVVTAK